MLLTLDKLLLWSQLTLQLQKRGTGPFITLISVSSLCQQIGPDLHSCQPDGAFTSSAPFQSLHTSNPLCLLPSFYFFQACLHWGHLIDGRAHVRRKNGSWRHEGSRWGTDQNGVLPAACKMLVFKLNIDCFMPNSLKTWVNSAKVCHLLTVSRSSHGTLGSINPFHQGVCLVRSPEGSCVTWRFSR